MDQMLTKKPVGSKEHGGFCLTELFIVNRRNI
jgi:hypothetical protein